MGFLDPTTDFRWLLPTETDANSPISEELMSQIRENLETNTMNRIYSGFRAEVVSRDTATQLTIQKVDSGDPDWTTNLASGLVLTMRDGGILGQNYDVVSNTALVGAGTATITVNALTPFPSGEPGAGDILLIMYAQTGQAHTHDGVDSAQLGIDRLEYEVNNKGNTSTLTATVGWQPLDTVMTDQIVPKSFIRRTATNNLLYADIYCYIPAQNRSQLNGADFRITIPAGTYEYTDDTGAYTSTVVGTTLNGPTVTLSGIPTGTGSIFVKLSPTNALDISTAGFNVGDMFRVYVECDIDVTTNFSMLGYRLWSRSTL